MHRKAKIGLVILAFPVLVTLLGIGRHYWVKQQLDSYVQKLEANGEPLDPKKFRSQIPPGGKLILLAKQLPTNPGDGPQAMQLTGPETAVALVQRGGAPPETPARKFFRDQAKLVAELQTELASPTLDSVPIGEAITNARTALKKTVRCLSMLALLQLEAGASGPALTAATQAVDALDRFGNDPGFLFQMNRAQLVHVDAALAWEILQVKGWTDAQLAGYQRHWEQVRVLSAWGEAGALSRAEFQFQMDYAREHQWKKLPPSVNPEGAQVTTTSLDEVKTLAKEVRDDPQAGLKSAFVRYPVFWSWDWWGSYDEQRVQLELHTQTVQAARAFQEGRPLAEVWPEVVGADAGRQASLDAVRATQPSFVEVPEAYPAAVSFRRMARAVAVRELVIAALALERFRLREGHYPEKLEALMPEFLSKPPPDPMDGKPLRYQRLPAGGYRLYSIGANLKDDGGDGSVDEDAQMLSNFNGKDILWPRAAVTATK